jgi:hypothetical protein
MASLVSQRLRQEVDLMERFSRSYRRKFAAMIERLNAADAPSDLQCVRLCVEAVDMMLASQTQVAQSLRELADGNNAVAAVRKVA